MSYGFVERVDGSLDRPHDTFYARQLSYPVLVTVYHMLECHGMDILPSLDAAVSSTYHEDSLKNSFKELLSVADADDMCVFSIEVRNTYGLPFEVTLQRCQQGMCFASK